MRTLALQLALAALVLALTWLGFQTGAPIRMPAILDVPGLAAGLNNLEQSERGQFRWSDGDARICALQAGRGARSVAEVTLAGDYALALGSARVTLQLNDGPALPLTLAPGLRRYQLLGAGADQPGADLCLRVGGDAVRDPNNNRSLGVPLYDVTLRQLPMAGPVQPAPGLLLLNLALTLGSLWLIRLLGAPWWAAGATVLGGVALFGALPWLIPAGAGLFNYMLPLAGGVLAALAGVLAARALARRAPDTPLPARDLLGMLYWSVVLVGGVWALQQVNGHHGAWPLKAGVDPNWTPRVALPAALFAGWAALALWLLHGARAARPAWLGPALVLAGAVALPVALEAAVLGWDSLYAVFRDSPYDYQRDTGLVGGDPLGFLRRYVELAPTMALHNSNHPPGSVLLLWGVEGLFGPGAVATSWAAILLSALAAAAALWLGWRLGGPRLALLAGAIYAVMPGHMVYSVTSMDGVFNAVNALGAAAFFLCLEPGARRRAAVAAGALIALGLFFTYSTTQLVFFGAAAAALAIVRRAAGQEGMRAAPVNGRDAPAGRLYTVPMGMLRAAAAPVLRQGLIAAGTIVAIYLLLFLATGFNVVQAAREATAENAIIVGKQLLEGPVRAPFLPPSVAFYVDFLGANLAPYLWYLAPWGLAALSAALLAGAGRRWAGLDAFDALLISVGACVLGMWLGGLFNREVERIWGFTYPLLAVLIARHALQGDGRAQLWRAGVALALFFAMSAVIKQLLNTAW
jgi:hypothetical protein